MRFKVGGEEIDGKRFIFKLFPHLLKQLLTMWLSISVHVSLMSIFVRANMNFIPRKWCWFYQIQDIFICRTRDSSNFEFIGFSLRIGSQPSHLHVMVEIRVRGIHNVEQSPDRRSRVYKCTNVNSKMMGKGDGWVCKCLPFAPDSCVCVSCN